MRLAAPRFVAPLVAALLVSFSSTDAVAAPDLALHALPDAPPPPALRYDLRVDLPVTAAATAFWIATELLKDRLAPAHCLLCETAPNGSSTVNGLDASARTALKWGDRRAADVASGALGFAIAPLAALGLDALAAGHDGRLREWPVDALLIAEATSVSADLAQIVKFSVGRERPFAHALSPGDLTPVGGERYLSFYSGHTSFAFALAVSAGTVATMRGYRFAALVWAVGLALAGTTGYLRVASDQHYLTDVLAGAAAGSLTGFAIPYLFHHPIRVGPFRDLTIAPGGALRGATIGVRGRF